MSLRPKQINDLVDAFSAWSLPRLREFAQLLDYDLAKEAPNCANIRLCARAFISAMNAARPPRDREMLELLQTEGNAALRNLATLLLEPDYVPTVENDFYSAISLGETAFIGRDGLRREIRNFTNEGVYSTRVLVVSGSDPCGKSYTYCYLKHLADKVGAEFADPLNVRQRNPTTREFFEAVGRKLRLNMKETDFPEAEDDPQEAKVWPYSDWLDGQIDTLEEPRWLTIDELNHPEVGRPALEAAFELARLAESKQKNLWVALLGYNDPTVAATLKQAVKEQPRFPNAAEVVTYFKRMAQEGQLQLQAGEALGWAQALFPAGATIDKEFMENTIREIERQGNNLARGIRPEDAPQE
ncbi:MAG: hypothetical protein ACK2U5_15210 [Candidatus Promineifilaceae bacterium]